jgi:outer membrane immunogenic protein
MKYNGFLLATAGGMAMVPGAQAADLAVKAPIMPPPPPASWTGWYIGVNAGAAWQSMHAKNNYSDSNVMQIDGSSFAGGGQIGYNWQQGSGVFGIEADLNGFSSGPSYTAPGVTNPKSISTKTNWLSTVRGRMGLAVADTMVYMTGGVAFGNVNNSQHLRNISDPFSTKSESKTKVGWVIGGGIEHMWNQHWTFGLEGLFVDLGKSEVTNFDPTVSSGVGKTSTFRNQIVIGRAKLNYKF